jgi:tricorn protease
VALADEYASSGGDCVVQALKSYGIATVVGARTWGGLRGVDLRYTLLDGTLVAQPKYNYWFADGGLTLENHGVEPDVEVAIAPHDWAARRDPQLDTAVQLALEALKQRTPAAPPTI